jgi:hypothetical protein
VAGPALSVDGWIGPVARRVAAAGWTEVESERLAEVAAAVARVVGTAPDLTCPGLVERPAGEPIGPKPLERSTAAR